MVAYGVFDSEALSLMQITLDQSFGRPPAGPTDCRNT
jgi:hypothetical protein